MSKNVALANVLQLSMFKWAEETHSVLAELTDLANKVDDKTALRGIEAITSTVERLVDQTIQNSIDAPVPMEFIDFIHSNILKMRQVIHG